MGGERRCTGKCEIQTSVPGPDITSQPRWKLLRIPLIGSTQVLKRHSDLGYTAVSLDPSALGKHLPKETILPGDVRPGEWDSFHDLIAMDEMARCGSLGTIWALGCGNSIGCPLLIKFGTEEQKSAWLPPVVQGDARFCLGCTEPQGECNNCSHVFFIRMFLVKYL